MTNKIRIRLKHNELIAMNNISNGYLSIYDPVGYSNMVTKELMTEIVIQIDNMLHNIDQKRYTLLMSGAQAMAFVAFWIRKDLNRHPYEMVLINRIIEMIHKQNLYANIIS